MFNFPKILEQLKLDSKVILLSFFICLILSGAFFFNPSQKLIGDAGDTYEFFGFMYLAKQNLLSLKHPFASTDTLRYPVGFDFSYGFDGVLAVLTGMGLSIILDAAVSYNLTVIFILFLNLYLSFVYFKKIGALLDVSHEINIKSYISAVIFGLSPFVFARINGHLNLAFVGGFPVLLYAVVRLYKKIVSHDLVLEHQLEPKIYYRYLNQKDFSLIFSGLLLVAMGSLQYLILTAYIFLCLFIVILVSGFMRTLLPFINLKSIGAFLRSLRNFLFLFIFFFWGYLKAIIAGTLVHADKGFDLTISDVFIPNGYLGFLYETLNPSPISIESVSAVGVLELLVFGVVFFTATKKFKMLIAGLVLTHILLTLNLMTLPYYSEGARFVVIVSLFLAIMFVNLKMHIPKNILLGLLVLLLLERLSFRVQTAPFAEFNVLKAVNRLDGPAVLNIPMSKYNAFRTALPYFYNKKIMDGYFHYTANTLESEAFFAHRYYSRFTCQEESTAPIPTSFVPQDRRLLLESMKADDVKIIVLFKDPNTSKFLHTSCTNVKDWWDWLGFKNLYTLKPTNRVEKLVYEFLPTKYNNSLELYSSKTGALVLIGLYVDSPVLAGLHIKTNSATLQNFEWQPLDGGLNVEFNPPLEITMQANESAIFEIAGSVPQPQHVVLYYSYTLADNMPTIIQPLIQEIYNDENVEIYQINY